MKTTTKRPSNAMRGTKVDRCHFCGCTDGDACVAIEHRPTGPQVVMTCTWVRPGLCSACAFRWVHPLELHALFHEWRARQKPAVRSRNTNRPRKPRGGL